MLGSKGCITHWKTMDNMDIDIFSEPENTGLQWNDFPLGKQTYYGSSPGLKHLW